MGWRRPRPTRRKPAGMGPRGPSGKWFNVEGAVRILSGRLAVRDTTRPGLQSEGVSELVHAFSKSGPTTGLGRVALFALSVVSAAALVVNPLCRTWLKAAGGS